MRKFRHISLVIVLLALALSIAPAQTTQALNGGEWDFGDAPNSYGTLLANNGACHMLGLLYLGLAPDLEVDGLPSPGADGDDNDGTDDEDGVTLPPSLTPGDPAANVTVVVGGSGSGYLDAWIDFNGNGVFDPPTEHLWGGVSQMVTPGLYSLTFAVPGDAVSGLTYARFRLDEEREPSLMLPGQDSHLEPTGEGHQGEVEDYLVEIIVPVGGHTETVSPLALLWLWLLLAAMVATGAIVAVTLKQRMA